MTEYGIIIFWIDSEIEILGTSTESGILDSVKNKSRIIDCNEGEDSYDNDDDGTRNLTS